MNTLKELTGREFHENGKEITYNAILDLAELLQYISVKVNNMVSVTIDSKTIEIRKDEFVMEVCSELEAGKTLVSAIRSTVFNRIRNGAIS